MKKFVAVATIVLLQGCSFMDTFCNYETVIPEAEPINISKELLEPCKRPVLPVLPLTYENILENNKNNMSLFIDCMNKMDANIVLLKKFSNNP